MNTNPHVIPWYTTEQWGKIRAISIDPDSMGTSYEHWLKAAKETAKREESPSVVVQKIYLDVDKLLAFSKRSGRDINSDTRVTYAIELLLGRV